MFLQLKRFDYAGRKDNGFYEFPIELRNETYKYSLDRSRYRLFAVVEHRGRSLRNGHYFSFAKKNEDWYKVNIFSRNFPLKN